MPNAAWFFERIPNSEVYPRRPVKTHEWVEILDAKDGFLYVSFLGPGPPPLGVDRWIVDAARTIEWVWKNPDPADQGLEWGVFKPGMVVTPRSPENSRVRVLSARD